MDYTGEYFSATQKGLGKKREVEMFVNPDGTFWVSYRFDTNCGPRSTFVSGTWEVKNNTLFLTSTKVDYGSARGHETKPVRQKETSMCELKNNLLNIDFDKAGITATLKKLPPKHLATKFRDFRDSIVHLALDAKMQKELIAPTNNPEELIVDFGFMYEYIDEMLMKGTISKKGYNLIEKLNDLIDDLPSDDETKKKAALDEKTVKMLKKDFGHLAYFYAYEAFDVDSRWEKVRKAAKKVCDAMGWDLVMNKPQIVRGRKK